MKRINDDKIKLYILENINLEEYDFEVQSTNELLAAVFDIFCSNKKESIELYGLEHSFISWLQGLPSILDLEFRTDKQIELLKEWGVVVPRDEDNVSKLFYKNIYRNFINMKIWKKIL